MYLSELRKFKPTPIKATDAEGHVQKFVPPRPPPSPEENYQMATDLKAYEEQAVEVEGQVVDGTGASTNTAAIDDDWFEDDEDDDGDNPTMSGH